LSIWFDEVIYKLVNLSYLKKKLLALGLSKQLLSQQLPQSQGNFEDSRSLFAVYEIKRAITSLGIY